jgi:hypothetical protein
MSDWRLRTDLTGAERLERYNEDAKKKEGVMKETKPEMRSFEGGATRNTDEGKIDYEGFLSPFALKAYCEYLDKHRVQADGKLRDSDNWQSGFGPGVCMKSLLRHTWDAWMIHRGGVVFEDGKVVSKKDALCAAMFNIMSQLHDMEKPEAETHISGCTAETCTYTFGSESCMSCSYNSKYGEKPEHKEDVS